MRGMFCSTHFLRSFPLAMTSSPLLFCGFFSSVMDARYKSRRSPFFPPLALGVERLLVPWSRVKPSFFCVFRDALSSYFLFPRFELVTPSYSLSFRVILPALRVSVTLLVLIFPYPFSVQFDGVSPLIIHRAQGPFFRCGGMYFFFLHLNLFLFLVFPKPFA